MPDDRSRLTAALAERYAILRVLGEGGMATVYLAEDQKHHRQVAVKVLRPEIASAVGSERFLLEVEIAARLSHPHIVALYDSGDADGFLFYVMPHITGESLRQKIVREGPLPLAEAVRITRQVASALEFAHARQVIHRDVKPENILLHEGEALVADFGIALAVSRAGDERLTETGLAVGTPEYMSPEQAMGEQTLDARSDVYSVACLLYEMLTGSPPYPGANWQAVMVKQAHDPVPLVRKLRPAVPAAVEQVLIRALAKAPGDRFPSMRAFSDALLLASAAPAAPAAPRSVAVLPFIALGVDAEQDYFAEGITEDVIAHLSKIKSLKVISRGSVLPFKKREQGLRAIASKLDVATILDGSVRRAGTRVRVVAQLIDAGTSQNLWAETYDRELTDIFAIQTDVALHIAAALRAELSPDERTRVRKEPTANVAAYQLYLQGRYCYIRFTPEGMKQGIEYYERAIALDPNYALAYAGIAMAYSEMGEGGTLPPDVAYARGRESAETALRLDPMLAEAHSALAYLKAVADYDWAGAEEGNRRAIELSPNSADAHDIYGRMCLSLERYDDALAHVTRAQELDPLVHRLDVATTLLRARRFDEALETAARAVEFDPQSARGHATLGWACFHAGRTEEGIAELERAAAVSGGSSQWLAQLGQAYALAGQPEKAREVLRTLEQRATVSYVSPYHLAYVFTGLGELDRALALLEQSVASRYGAVHGMKGSFLFWPLRGHPKFTELLRRLNLA